MIKELLIMEYKKTVTDNGVTYKTRPNIYSIDYIRETIGSNAFKNNPLSFINQLDNETINQDFIDMKLVLYRIPKEAGIKYIEESLKFSNLLKDTFILHMDLLKLNNYLDKLHYLRVFVLEKKVNIYSLEFINYYLDHEDTELFTDLLNCNKINDDFLNIEHCLNNEASLTEIQAINYIFKTIEFNKKLNENIYYYDNYNLYIGFMRDLRKVIINNREKDYELVTYGRDGYKDTIRFYLGDILIFEMDNSGQYKYKNGDTGYYKNICTAEKDRICEKIKGYLIEGMSLEEIKTCINVTME